MSSERLNYTVLGVLITDRCNFSCRHCCTQSGPSATTNLELGDIFRCIDEAVGTSIQEVGISGGEPFLLRRELANIIRYAALRGFRVSVTSNGFWARTPERAEKILRALVSDGLTGLSVSLSKYHLEFADAARVRNAMRAALEMALIARVNYVRTGDFSLGHARALVGELAELIEFVDMAAIPAGRARTEVPEEDLPYRRDIPRGTCARDFTKLAIAPDATAYPCCSPGGFTPPLALGSVKDSTVHALLKTAGTRPLLDILATVGPAFFMPFIEAELGRDALPRHFTDQCHLCNEVLGDPQLAAIALEGVRRLTEELSEQGLTVQAFAEQTCQTTSRNDTQRGSEKAMFASKILHNT